MSERDSTPQQPRHSTSPKSPDELVADIMEREAKLEPRPRPDVKRRSWIPILVALLVIFTGLTAWNVARMIYEPAIFSKEELESDALFTIFVTSQGLEAHWDAMGTFPRSLEEIALDDDDLHYARLNDSTYVLTITVGASELVYRRGEDISRFVTAADVLGGEAAR